MWFLSLSELRSCEKVEEAVLGSPSVIPNPYGFRGRKATLKQKFLSELRSCVEAVLGSPSLTVLNMVSVDVKQHSVFGVWRF